MTDSAYKFRFEPEGNQGQQSAKGQTKRKRHRSDPPTVYFFSLGGPLLLRLAPFISLIECSLCFAFIIFIVAFTTTEQEKKKPASAKFKSQTEGTTDGTKVMAHKRATGCCSNLVLRTGSECDRREVTVVASPLRRHCDATLTLSHVVYQCVCVCVCWYLPVGSANVRCYCQPR